MANRISRLNSRDLKKIKKNLINRNGQKCNICGNRFSFKKLKVEHINNNYLDNNMENLQLACQSCNIKKNPPYQKKKDVDIVCARECVSLDEAPKPQSAEMARNMKSEPMFISWLEKEMKEHNKMEIEDVVCSGAQYSGVSIDTVRTRYLKKLTSRLGPYNVIEELGVKYIVWKITNYQDSSKE